MKKKIRLIKRVEWGKKPEGCEMGLGIGIFFLGFGFVVFSFVNDMSNYFYYLMGMSSTIVFAIGFFGFKNALGKGRKVYWEERK